MDDLGVPLLLETPILGTYPHLMGFQAVIHLRFLLTNLVLTHNDLEIENLKSSNQMMPSCMSIVWNWKFEKCWGAPTTGLVSPQVKRLDVGFLVRCSIYIHLLQENLTDWISHQKFMSHPREMPNNGDQPSCCSCRPSLVGYCQEDDT